MKRYILVLLMLIIATTSFSQSNQGSNPGVVDLAASPIRQDETGYLDAAFQNSGFDPMPAGTYSVTFTIDPNILEWVTPVFDISSNEGDWTLFSQTTQQVTFRNSNGAISPSEIMVFALQVRVKPTAPTGTTPFTMRVEVTPGQSNLAGNTDNSDPDDFKSAELTVDQALPVTLISFNVTKEVNTASLKWTTTEEVNSDYFEVQHSTNGKNWVAVGKVESHKDSKGVNKYFFNHPAPVNGDNYYRLKMVDRDYTYAYSHIDVLRFEGLEANGFYVYPNPVVEKVMLKNYASIAEASILNHSGVQVLKSNKVSDQGFDVRSLQNGLYLIKVKDLNGNTSIKKFVIKK